MTTKTKDLFGLTSLLVMALMLTACAGPADKAVEPTASAPLPTGGPAALGTPVSGRGVGGTLRILFWQAPTTLNPHLSTGQKDWNASRVTYEPLASFDKNGQLVPFLAAEIPSLENGGVAANGKSVTWKLKRDVKWSDGTPFTAQDVRFTYEFIANYKETGATTYTTYDAVSSVEAIDDYTVKVNFKDVNPAWALSFVGVQGMIIPYHTFKDYNGPNAPQAPANLMPVGTGPYHVVKFKPEEVLFLGNNLVETNKIVFEPNPYFREPDKPYFSRVELKGGGTVNEAARSVLQVGDVDFSNNLQIDSATQHKMEAAGKGKILAPFGAFVERILLNRTDPNQETGDGERSSIQFPHPIFSDKKVRQAFALAVDREAIAKLYGPTGQPTSNILVSPDIYQSPNTSYEFNLKKAAELLDEAGWKDSDGDGIRDKNGVKMSVLFQTSANPVRQQTQAIVKNALASIGVEIKLTFVDSSVFFASDPSNPNTRHHFYADMEMFSTANRSPDPGAYMKSWTCDERAQKANKWAGLNKERWCDPAYDALYQQSVTQIDPEIRRQLFVKMNDMLIDDVVVIPLVRQADISGVSNALEGVDLTPWDADLWNIKDWRRNTP